MNTRFKRLHILKELQARAMPSSANARPAEERSSPATRSISRTSTATSTPGTRTTARSASSPTRPTPYVQSYKFDSASSLGQKTNRANEVNFVYHQVGLKTKNPKRASKPGKQHSSTSFSSSTPNRKLYRSVVNSTAGRGYRMDLRREAVARASAIKRSQSENKKDTPASKPRGAKARRANEAASGST